MAMLYTQQNKAAPISTASKSPKSPNIMYVWQLFIINVSQECPPHYPFNIKWRPSFPGFLLFVQKFQFSFFTIYVSDCIYWHLGDFRGMSLTMQSLITLAEVSTEGLVFLSLYKVKSEASYTTHMLPVICSTNP